jgi:hypothetical protein
MPVGRCAVLIQDAKDSLKKVRNLGENVKATVGDLKRYCARDTISAGSDAARNMAMIDARSRANGVNRELNRGFAAKNVDLKDAPSREALTFAVEAGGKKAKLAEFREKIAGSKAAATPHGKAALAAIDFAARNWERMEPTVAKYREETKGQHRAENAAGLTTPYRENYVPHAQDVMGDEFDPPFAKGAGGPGSAFKKQRSYPTYADSIADGVKPKSLDAVSLLEDRINRGQNLVNRQAWAEMGRHIDDSQTGMPIIADLEHRVVKRPGQPNAIEINTPQGYERVPVGNRDVAVLRGYAGLYKSLTQPSAFDNSVIGRALMQGVGAAKHVVLGLDMFHPFRIAFWNLGLRGKSTFKKGGWLLDQTMPEIEKDIRAKGLPPALETKAIAEARQQKINLDTMVRHGLNVGSIVDNVHKDLTFALPGIGRALKGYNKFIFDSFQRGAMSESALYAFDKIRRDNPTWTTERAAREAAKTINTRFGNLGDQSFVKNKTFRDLTRLAFLAPQWNEGLIRSEVSGAKDLATAPFKGHVPLIGRSIGVMIMGQFVANQFINMATRGHPTWKNPEESPDSKVAAWIPDKIGTGHGLFLDPFSLPAEITGDLVRGQFRRGNLKQATLDILKNKMSPLTRGTTTYFQNKDSLGTPINSGWDMAKALGSVFLPIQAPALTEAYRSAVAGHIKEPYPGSTEKQLLANAGIRASLAPSFEQRIQSLAAKYKAENGIASPPELNPSDYKPFFRALQRNDPEDAAVELEQLKAKKTPKQIANYLRSYDKHPFTGSTEREVKFIQTLSDEQKQAYIQARIERHELAQKAIRFIVK